MSDIWQILEMERDNNRQIRLYRIDMYWIAFERSAFNLFSVCNVDNIVKIKDMKEEKNSMLIAIVKNGTPILYNPQFTILEKSENEILLGCRTTCRGFQHWKDSLISLFTENLYPTQDEKSRNIYHLNLEVLLN
ncbi:hypothetical protein [Dysgonomonas sp.]|jgi:hypothetical protein|nr:hypothetical protein [Prevotella sp.]